MLECSSDFGGVDRQSHTGLIFNLGCLKSGSAQAVSVTCSATLLNYVSSDESMGSDVGQLMCVSVCT